MLSKDPITVFFSFHIGEFSFFLRQHLQDLIADVNVDGEELIYENNDR